MQNIFQQSTNLIYRNNLVKVKAEQKLSNVSCGR